ncbi:type II toxin-antitoxin system ParD family antitoxin [Paenimyroides baculatum]
MAKNTSILLGDYFDNFINSQIKIGKIFFCK